MTADSAPRWERGECLVKASAIIPSSASSPNAAAAEAHRNPTPDDVAAGSVRRDLKPPRTAMNTQNPPEPYSSAHFGAAKYLDTRRSRHARPLGRNEYCR